MAWAQADTMYWVWALQCHVRPSTTCLTYARRAVATGHTINSIVERTIVALSALGWWIAWTMKTDPSNGRCYLSRNKHKFQFKRINHSCFDSAAVSLSSCCRCHHRPPIALHCISFSSVLFICSFVVGCCRSAVLWLFYVSSQTVPDCLSEFAALVRTHFYFRSTMYLLCC